MGELVSMKQRFREAETLSATVQWCGHSTVIITSEDEKRFIIDPWLRGNPSCPESLHNPPKIDYIVLTHGHSDHSGSILELAEKHESTIFANYELANLLVKDGIPAERIQFMNKGGSVLIPHTGGLMVSLTDAKHSSSYDLRDGSTAYAGEACGVVITLESGRNIYHAGDTAVFGDMKLIQELFEPELALLPIGDRFTMGPKQAAKALQLIKPRFVVPIHHSTFDLLLGKPEMLRTLIDELQTKLVVLEPGEEFEF